MKMVFDGPEILDIIKTHAIDKLLVPPESVKDVRWDAVKNKLGEWELEVTVTLKTTSGSPYRNPA